MQGQDKDPRKQQEDGDDDDRKPPAKVVFFRRHNRGAMATEENSVASLAATADSLARTTTDESGCSQNLNSPSNTNTRRLVASIVPARAITAPPSNTTTATRRHRQGWLREELILLAGTSALSLLAFLYIILPFTALASLALFLSSTTMLTFTLQQYVLQEYDTIVTGRGLGQYLPAWFYQLLTQQTLHDFLTDPTFGLEYRHLLLYFLPISAQQRDIYLNRIAPHHRQVLQRPGLGHLVDIVTGSFDFMRAIVGQEQWQQQQQQQQQQSANGASGGTATGGQGQPAVLPAIPEARLVEPVVQQAVHPEPQVQRLLYDDDDDSNSDLGLDVSDNDLTGGLSVQQATNMARYLGLGGRNSDNNTHQTADAVAERSIVQAASTAAAVQRTAAAAAATPPVGNNNDEVQQAEYDNEEAVLMDALWSAFDYSLWNPATRFLADATVRVERPFLQGTLGLTLLSGGLGVWGYWNGIYSQPSFSVPRVEYPSSRLVIGATVVGGASAGLLLLARSWLRPAAAPSDMKSSRDSPADKKQA